MKKMTYKEMIEELVNSIDIDSNGNFYGGLADYGIDVGEINSNGELFDDIDYAYKELGGSFEDGVDENILYAALEDCKSVWMDSWLYMRCFYENWEKTIEYEFMEELEDALDEIGVHSDESKNYNQGKNIYEKIAKEWKEAVGYIADDYDDCLFEIEHKY